MRALRLVLALFFQITMMASAMADTPPSTDRDLQAELSKVAQKRIYFSHQSVGANLLDGLQQLSKQSGVVVRIEEASNASAVPQSTIGHQLVGENGDPLGKIQAFDQAIGTSNRSVDVAMLKFCYVDFSPQTNVKALFEKYRHTVEEIRARNPGLAILHITTPLTDVQTGTKAFLKRLLGRAPYGVLENQKREEYNALLRKTYQGKEPFFDLATIESTAPDGAVSAVEWQGQVIPKLATTYTDDGGHLNALGRTQVARRLVSALAAIPKP